MSTEEEFTPLPEEGIKTLLDWLYNWSGLSRACQSLCVWGRGEAGQVQMSAHARRVKVSVGVGMRGERAEGEGEGRCGNAGRVRGG